MTDMRKITAFVPEQLLAQAQTFTGVGVTETLKIALEELNRKQFYREMQALRGKLKFPYDLDELREDRDLSQFGKKS